MRTRRLLLESLFLVYWVIRRLFELLVLFGHSERAKEVEILMLRHELQMLKRRAGRPRIRSTDRVLLAALSQVSPRKWRRSFLVQPETLLRWHRELVRRRWPTKVGGRGDRRWPNRGGSSSCGSRRRTRLGGTSGYTANWSGSELRSRQAACGTSCMVTVSSRRRGERTLAGGSSFVSRRPRSSSVTSSSSTRFCCAASTCSSSSNCRAVASIWPASPCGSQLLDPRERTDYLRANRLLVHRLKPAQPRSSTRPPE
jgi:hypothetical protein